MCPIKTVHIRYYAYAVAGKKITEGMVTTHWLLYKVTDGCMYVSASLNHIPACLLRPAQHLFIKLSYPMKDKYWIHLTGNTSKLLNQNEVVYYSRKYYEEHCLFSGCNSQSVLGHLKKYLPSTLYLPNHPFLIFAMALMIFWIKC